MTGFLTELITDAIHHGRDKPLLELERRNPHTLIEATLSEFNDLPADVVYATLRYLVTVVKRTSFPPEVYRQLFKGLVEGSWLAQRVGTDRDMMAMTAYCSLVGQVSRRAQLNDENYMHLVSSLVESLPRFPEQTQPTNRALIVPCLCRVLKELFTRRLPTYRATQRHVLNAVLGENRQVIRRYAERCFAQGQCCTDAARTLGLQEFQGLVQAMVLSPVFDSSLMISEGDIDMLVMSLDVNGICTVILQHAGSLMTVIDRALAHRVSAWPTVDQWSVLICLAEAMPSEFNRLVVKKAHPTGLLMPLVTEILSHKLPTLCDSVEDHIEQAYARNVDIALQTAGEVLDYFIYDSWTVSEGAVVAILGRSPYLAGELRKLNNPVINTILSTLSEVVGPEDNELRQ